MGRVGIGTVGLVANPRAGRGLASRAADRAVARLTERGVSVVADGFTITTDLGRITADDGTSRWFGTVLDAPVTLTAFGNTRSYGGGMAICPAADYSDGLLGLTVIGEASRVRAVRTLSKLFSGDHVMFDEVTVHRTRSARVDHLGVGGHCSYADGGGMAICPSPSRRCRRSAATSCRGPDPASTAAPVHDWIRREYFGGGG